MCVFTTTHEGQVDELIRGGGPREDGEVLLSNEITSLDLHLECHLLVRERVAQLYVEGDGLTSLRY